MSQVQPKAPFLPVVPPAHFARNFLQQVVCELRFPTLFELDTSKPHEAFARSLRKSYPHHSHAINEMRVNGDEFSREHVHIFKSKNLNWTATLRPSAITIETTKYESFADLVGRMQQLLTIAKEVIDSDFFTRIGLRYINALPFDGKNLKELDGWVRSDLVKTLVTEDLGSVHEYSSRIAGTADFGGFHFQHGVGYEPTTKDPQYMLDFDFWRENVELGETLETLDQLHKHQFSMFVWAIGDRAKDYLGPTIGREGG